VLTRLERDGLTASESGGDGEKSWHATGSALGEAA
jgi:hypothetical protein